MKVREFNTDIGLYLFDFDTLETAAHSHPAIEIIIAEKGVFTVNILAQEFTNLTFAVIEANQIHSLSAANCSLKVLMIEHHTKLVSDYLALQHITCQGGYYVARHCENKYRILSDITVAIKDRRFSKEYDDRITTIVNFLNNNDVEYKEMIKTLKSFTHLSESRLSHLVKSNLGVSLKKYLVWTKLKSTIKLHLNKKDDLLTSLLTSGFYDQPHFSKNFKAMFGVKPSRAYNSRIIQG